MSARSNVLCAAIACCQQTGGPVGLHELRLALPSLSRSVLRGAYDSLIRHGELVVVHRRRGLRTGGSRLVLPGRAANDDLRNVVPPANGAAPVGDRAVLRNLVTFFCRHKVEELFTTTELTRAVVAWMFAGASPPSYGDVYCAMRNLAITDPKGVRWCAVGSQRAAWMVSSTGFTTANVAAIESGYVISCEAERCAEPTPKFDPNRAGRWLEERLTNFTRNWCSERDLASELQVRLGCAEAAREWVRSMVQSSRSARSEEKPSRKMGRSPVPVIVGMRQRTMWCTTARRFDLATTELLLADALEQSQVLRRVFMHTRRHAWYRTADIEVPMNAGTQRRAHALQTRIQLIGNGSLRRTTSLFERVNSHIASLLAIFGSPQKGSRAGLE